MNFIELATQRYSVRNFEPKPVEMEKLLYVLEAARIAPSAVNFQPWKFLVFTDREMLKSIQAIYHRTWLATAPAIIVAMGDHSKGWHRKTDGKDFTDIDVAIAIDHMTLAATEQGLGTCWICNFDNEKSKQLFKTGDNFETIAIIPIGYPVSEPKPTKKRE
ncbi:MAG TPA: nitroreductase family protein, partial [Prolixibacteraceae bacterium]